MQTNMAPLSVEFMGTQNINGYPAVMEGSNRMLESVGGIISNGNTDGAAVFGVVLSVIASGAGTDDSAFYVGQPTSAYTVIGILLNEQGIQENDPAKPNYINNEQMATAVRKGRLLYTSWDLTATGSIAPYVGVRVIFNNTTGLIGFLKAGAAVPTGYTQLQADVANVSIFSGQAEIDFFIPQAR
jgi:hypothetical protein